MNIILITWTYECEDGQATKPDIKIIFMLPATLKTPRFIYWPLLNVKNEVQVKASKFLSTDWLIFTAVSLYWILKWMTVHYVWSAKLEGSEPEVFLMFKVWSVIWFDLLVDLTWLVCFWLFWLFMFWEISSFIILQYFNLKLS